MDSQIKFAISSPVIVMIIMKFFVRIVALLALSSLITSLPISNQDDSKGLTNSLSVLSQKTGAALTPVLGSKTLFGAQKTGLDVQLYYTPSAENVKHLILKLNFLPVFLLFIISKIQFFESKSQPDPFFDVF